MSLTATVQVAIKHGAPLPAPHRYTLVDELARLVRSLGHAAIEADDGALDILVPGLLQSDAQLVATEMQYRADLGASYYWGTVAYDGQPPGPTHPGTRGTVITCRTATVLR